MEACWWRKEGGQDGGKKREEGQFISRLPTWVCSIFKAEVTDRLATLRKQYDSAKSWITITLLYFSTLLFLSRSQNQYTDFMQGSPSSQPFSILHQHEICVWSLLQYCWEIIIYYLLVGRMNRGIMRETNLTWFWNRHVNQQTYCLTVGTF